MNLMSWGNYPKIKNNSFKFNTTEELKNIINKYDDLISYGNGKSYGDSALNKNIIQVKSYNYFLNFEQSKGMLKIQAGVLLADILDIFVPRGWFLRITPGTKFITVGGAIASDVHGKNHHIEGCFSECVNQFSLMLPSGKIVSCSKQKNSELFKATCGGMGLTGVILDAVIALKKINSKYIKQTTIKTKNLKETFAMFEKYSNMTYSVAWIDCFAKDKTLGKCLLTVGDFNDDGKLDYKRKKQLNLAFNFPSFFLGNISIKLFNFLYYKKVIRKISKQTVDFNSFFYPLDRINNWNRLYGKNGFCQYQFILPKSTSFEGLKEVLETIANSSKGSFLAVLKLYGKANANYLSFPLEGYSLALDFKIEKGLFTLLERLDKIILKYKGRIYLAKDARVSKAVFECGYSQIDKFRALRKKYKMHEKFNSLQSQRLNI